MSRDIKFRAWSRKRNRYYKISRIEFDLNRNATHVIVWEEDYLKFNIEHLIIEQYTGLKDKNGVEVYVGDIVRLCESTYPCLVYWDGLGFSWLVNGKRRYIDLTISKMNIIGNIHENKEMLK